MNIKRLWTIVAVGIALNLSAGRGRGDIGEQPPESQRPKFRPDHPHARCCKRVMTVEATPLSKTFGIAPDCEVTTKDKPKATVDDLTVGTVCT